MWEAMKRLARAVQSFDDDEDGIEVLQVVMILAIAGMVVAILIAWGNDIVEWAKGFLPNQEGGTITDE